MKSIKLIFPLAILNLIALILVTLGLPDIVPLHVNIYGAVDLVGSKWYIPLTGLIPIFTAIYISLKNSNFNKDLEDKVISATTCVLIAISWVPILLALTYDLNSIASQNFLDMKIMSYIGIVLGILFVFMGYYLKKIKQNKIIGIRTPWTLKNEKVWEKTHKLGSPSSILGGFILLIFSIATYLTGNWIYSLIGLGASLFLIAVIPISYSYYKYNKIRNSQ